VFEKRSEEIAELAGGAAVDACWAQWAALGSPASSARRAAPASMIDVEALILLSLHVSARERRLRDLVAWWARVGSALTSVQRFRSVAEAYERTTIHGLATFANLAVEEGDRRWLPHTGQGAAAPPTREKGTDAPSLAEPCALWPRLRAGFGVGAKADVLAYLLGSGGAWVSTKAIAFATDYSTVTVRSAASEMALAGFIAETGERPAEYSADPAAWAALLDLRGNPPAAAPWRFWAEIFAFLAGAIAWAGAVSAPDAAGSHVLASRARDLMERRERAFALAHVPVPNPAGYKGLEATDGLLATTRAVAEWVEAHL
jgi:hypothetical protein